jgi:hypothetical protein
MEATDIKMFINKNSNLFWYIPNDKKDNISHELLTETILNYGSLDDFRELVRIMGINSLSAIFNGLQGRKKKNYYPEIHHFFSLIFAKYASGNPQSGTN